MLYAVQIWFPTLHIAKPLINNKNDWLTTDNVTHEHSLELCKKLAAELYENVHLKFLKWILGVHPKTSNIGVWGETGSGPLTYECLKLTIKYFNRIQSLNDNSFLSCAFKKQRNLNLPWYCNLTKRITTNISPTNPDNEPQTAPPQPQPSAFLIHNCFVRDPAHTNLIETLTSAQDIPLTSKLIQTVISNLQNNFDQSWETIKSKSPK